MNSAMTLRRSVKYTTYNNNRNFCIKNQIGADDMVAVSLPILNSLTDLRRIIMLVLFVSSAGVDCMLYSVHAVVVHGVSLRNRSFFLFFHNSHK